MKTQGFFTGLHAPFLITLATFFLAAPLCAQLTNFQRLHSFGNTNLAGANPRRVIEGADGPLYGVARVAAPAFVGLIYCINRDGTGYRILHRFPKGDPAGESPDSLIEGTDGALYGVTTEGTTNNQGAIFRINKSGTDITTLHAFPASQGGFTSPRAPLIEGTDGALYGVSWQGGAGFGAVFKLQKDGTGFQVLKSFGGTSDGAYPLGGLTEASDGWLYGTTSFGGTGANGGGGTIFKIRKDGSGYQILVHLLGGASQPANPLAEMIEASDGALYGTSRGVFQGNRGTVFKLQKDGTGFLVLRSFTSTNEPAFPMAPVAEGPDGALYGTTFGGGDGDQGALFKINKDGSGFRVLHLFPAGFGDGSHSIAPLVLSRDGFFYGSTQYEGQFSVGTLFRLNPANDNYSTIWQFSTAGGEPWVPLGPLAPDRFGNLYGATAFGGDANRGVIYRIHQNGTAFEIVRNIPLTTNTAVVREIIVASDGNLYGTSSPNGFPGPGTLFKLAPDGSGFSMLQTFNPVQGDGSSPLCRITEGSDAKLYATTRRGGPGGSDAVFRINKDGSGYEILRVFGQIVADGHFVENPVMEASDGRLYGVTSGGGTNNAGTVFRLNRDGIGYAQLYSFKADPSDGIYPSGRLLEASDGFLYGVTAYGGYFNMGTIYKLRKDGTDYAVIWRFTDTFSRISSMAGGPLLEGNDGALYGATQQGGNYHSGFIFKINKDGTAFTQLHHFDGTSSPSAPSAGMVRGSDGAFYGTHGIGSEGVLYRFGQMIALARQPSTAQLTCTGIPGIMYEVQCSTDLQNWSTLLQRNMPASPAITCDHSTPPANAAFYRVVPMGN
jgi:uncharacterized repeat protein (TIGR03803 family)